jgi:hypothetical protein
LLRLSMGAVSLPIHLPTPEEKRPIARSDDVKGPHELARLERHGARPL